MIFGWNYSRSSKSYVFFFIIFSKFEMIENCKSFCTEWEEGEAVHRHLTAIIALCDEFAHQLLQRDKPLWLFLCPKKYGPCM